jgi:hypothetical protein
MTRTSHGHHIPGSRIDDEMERVSVARCGGVKLCTQCIRESAGVPQRPSDTKLTLHRWEWDTIADVLIDKVPSYIQTWMDERFTIRTRNPYLQYVTEVPVHYIFFGFKQEMTKWRLKHGISPKDTTLARDWVKLQGLRARPIPVYDWGWMRNNTRHEIALRARHEIYGLESRYGSGPELYRSYDV